MTPKNIVPQNEPGFQLIQADILKWAETYTGPKFHAALLDSPYHLTITKRFGKAGSAPAKGDVYNRASKGFMGQSWDGGDLAFQPETWAAISEHHHPGAFIMAFAGTRGYHRMACAMEDAGLIIHPAIGWVTIQGFPKSTRVDIQCEQELCYCIKDEDGKHWYYKADNEPIRAEPPFRSGMANTWSTHRYGLQAQKPAFEFIAVTQKPYEGRPVDCITATGAGALNIEGSRIPGPAWRWGTVTDIRGNGYGSRRPSQGDIYDRNVESDPAGRWPANLILDEAGAALLDQQSGNRPAGNSVNGTEPSEMAKNVYSGRWDREPWQSYDDSGGASRMFFKSHFAYEVLEQITQADPVFYEPKVSAAEREAGLDDLPTRIRKRVNSGGLENEPRFAPTQVKNNHPTLKPIALCKYLATLLLPPDAYTPRRLLVPFAGTGSEMIGGILAGFEQVIGIEKNAHYVEIGRTRLAWWSQWPGWGQSDVDKILAAEIIKADETQLRMF